METLRFGCLNTSLAPGGKRRASWPDKRALALELVRQLVDEEGVDLLAHSEEATEDVQHLYAGCSARSPALRRIAAIEGESIPGGIAMLYNKNLLTPVDQEILSTTYMASAIRRCLHVTFRLYERPASLLHVFAL